MLESPKFSFLPKAGSKPPHFGPVKVVETTKHGKTGFTSSRIRVFPAMNAMQLVPKTAKFTTIRPEAAKNLPASFDWRNDDDVAARNKTLSSTLSTSLLAAIKDQGQCGCCFAISSATILQDRWSISAGKNCPNLSTSDACACPKVYVPADSDMPDTCCDGGLPYYVGKYFEVRGVPSQTCVPDTFLSGSSPSCSTSCTDTTLPYDLYTATAESTTTLTKLGETQSIIDENIAAMKAELYQNGPIVSCFYVYDDFMSGSYTGDEGVYVCGSTNLDGGHAVVFDGWGVTAKGLSFWWLRNSWASSWGISGRVKVAMASTTVNAQCGFNKTVNGFGGAYSWLPNTKGAVNPVSPASGQVISGGSTNDVLLIVVSCIAGLLLIILIVSLAIKS